MVEDLIVRKHIGTTWAVIQRYGYHETLISVQPTKQQAQDYIRVRASILREPFHGNIRDTDA
jgi:hypothetical protein